jgi:hypothetical protein
MPTSGLRTNLAIKGTTVNREVFFDARARKRPATDLLHFSQFATHRECTGRYRHVPIFPGAFVAAGCAVLADTMLADESHVSARASGPKQNHFIWFRIAAFHARRADRHAGNGKTCRVRFFGQEAL